MLGGELMACFCVVESVFSPKAKTARGQNHVRSFQSVQPDCSSVRLKYTKGRDGNSHLLYFKSALSKSQTKLRFFCFCNAEILCSVKKTAEFEGFRAVGKSDSNKARTTVFGWKFESGPPLKTFDGFFHAKILELINQINWQMSKGWKCSNRNLTQARIQDFGQGGPVEFWPQRWAQHLLKIRVFPWKLPENCMILKKSWGRRGVPPGPPWIR